MEDELKLCWLRHRPREHSASVIATSGQSQHRSSTDFIERIIRSYRAAIATGDKGSPTSMWEGPLAEIKHKEHSTLLDGDVNVVGEMLHNPTHSMLCYGFDELMLFVEGRTDPASALVKTSEWLYDNLRRLAESVGAIRLANPENYGHHSDLDPGIENILSKLDDHFGVRVAFPNPYAGEVGLATSRGIVSYRTIQAIYQAWRAVNLATTPRVLEIGPGLGRTAFYLKLFGVGDYVGIDIPLSNVAQAHFLGTTLGESTVRLHGEKRDGFQIVPDRVLTELEGHFDVVLNADSLTEIDRATATTYWRFIEKRCGVLLSINHEDNPFTVRDLYSGNTLRVERYPYWMRRGYVEEVVRFKA
ncbi:hypothetical protein OZ411_01170 [Bradyrhizobium sp. Arg237L]|uniref:hypothetical protein n=1 Tax=Bradyrhizobium sp. Arg237L TaxID=3003352 RepID=UPI00249F0A8B|nr:hypothetical protein [Bradyrhizobium sp. Arg237L]MDI4231424.1 hypothetical protein [Bradyrhizobium sp. Arg237L]